MNNYPTTPLAITSVSGFSWLEGTWIGEDQDQLIEEQWTTARGNVLLGIFRMVQTDKPRFYEFMTIGIEDERCLLRIKHFDPKLIGWEEKDQSVEYILVSLENDQAVFYKRSSDEPNWLIYNREGRALSAHFENVDGEIPDSRFEFASR